MAAFFIAPPSYDGASSLNFSREGFATDWRVLLLLRPLLAVGGVCMCCERHNTKILLLHRIVLRIVLPGDITDILGMMP